MPTYVALEWSKQQPAGLHGHVSKSNVDVSQSFVLTWPEGMDPAEQPQEAGAWLKAEFDRRGVRGKQLLVAVPREEVVVRTLEVPDASGHTLAGLVRYRAGAESSVPLEQLVLDYVPLPERTADGGRTVLTATVARQLIDTLQAIARAAGMQLVSVGISSLAALELVARIDPQHAAESGRMNLVVARTGLRIEISLMRDRHVLFTHATRLAGDDLQRHEQAVLGEVSRALMAFDPATSGGQVDCAWLIAARGELSGLAESLQQRLRCEVHEVDTFDAAGIDFPSPGVEHPMTEFAAPLGMLFARNDATVAETIDLLRPRRPVVRRSRRKVQVGLIAAAVLCVVVIGLVARHVYLRGLDSEIEQKRVQQQQLDLLLRQGEPVLRRADSVGQWQKQNVNWLEQMEKVSSSMPPADRMYLDNWRLQSIVGEATARVQADGHARERDDVELLNQRLADQQGYRVQPNEIRSGPSFEDFPIQFEVDADVVSASGE